MKVLMTADAVGGVWTYARELCAALADADVQVVLAVMGPRPSAAQIESMQRLPNVTLLAAHYRLEWMSSPWRDVERAGAWLLELAERMRVDLVHLNGYAHAALPWKAPVLVVAHSCVLSWWQAVHNGSPPNEWDVYAQNVSAGLRAADCIVAPTRAFLRQLEALYGELAQALVIHNARTAGEFTPSSRREAFVFAAGRVWDRAKNMSSLDAAAKGLAWPVFIAGDLSGPEHAEWRCEHAKTLGTLHPDSLSAWLRQASIYASVPLYEPFGLSVLEAAHAGCALVLSDIPSLRELWTDAALFVPPRDPQALHAALAELSRDAGRLETLAAAARRRAAAFHPQRMAMAYFTVYRRLLSEARAAHQSTRFTSPRSRRSGFNPTSLSIPARMSGRMSE